MHTQVTFLQNKHKIMQKNKFSERLNRYLKNNKIKKGNFARSIGLTRDALYKYETNQRVLPTIVKRAIMQYTNNIIHFDEVK